MHAYTKRPILLNKYNIIVMVEEEGRGRGRVKVEQNQVVFVLFFDME